LYFWRGYIRQIHYLHVKDGPHFNPNFESLKLHKLHMKSIKESPPQFRIPRYTQLMSRNTGPTGDATTNSGNSHPIYAPCPPFVTPCKTLSPSQQQPRLPNAENEHPSCAPVSALFRHDFDIISPSNQETTEPSPQHFYFYHVNISPKDIKKARSNSSLPPALFR